MENYCPKCQHDMLRYGAFMLENNEQGYYPFICPECGCRGKEWFELNYKETEEDSDADIQS